MVTVVLMTFACDDLDYKPANQIDNETIGQSAELLGNLTIGTYSRLPSECTIHIDGGYRSIDAPILYCANIPLLA